MENQGEGVQAPQAAQAPAAAPAAQPAPAAQTAPVAQAAPVQAAPAAPAQTAPAAAQENERTSQQFEKLLESNKRLYEANELLRQEMQRRAQSNQTFQPITQTPPVQQNAGQQPVAKMPQASDFVEVDPTTGERFINEAKFQNAVSDIQQKATRAEEVVNNYIKTAEQREIDRQNREAYQSYPELNASSAQFDVNFNKQTRAILYDSMINPSDYGGRALSFKEAADFIRGTTAPKTAVATPAAPQVDPAVAAANQMAKEQASLAATPQPINNQQSVSDEEAHSRLVQGTRLGSDEALARRLLHSPHKIEDVMGETNA